MRSDPFVVGVGLLSLTTAGCATNLDDSHGDEGGIGMPQTGGDGGDSGEDESGGDDGDGGAPVFDVGPPGGGGGDGDETTCKKVDLLFVIDNSASMEDEQNSLIASFPGFVDAMKTELADTLSYHVGVTTTDAYHCLETDCQVEGALVTQTCAADCGPYASGGSYMTEPDMASDAFACAANVDIDGDPDERPIRTAKRALSDDLNAAGACNEGFFRDDALLVLVFITDEEDDQEIYDNCSWGFAGSGGEPAQWFQEIVDLKGGVETNIVTLSLIGPTGAAVCPPLDQCWDGIVGAQEATRLVQFTELFTFGFVGPVCSASYDGFFRDAVGLIDSACDGFRPPE